MPGQAVEQRRLARPRSARDQDVAAAAADDAQDLGPPARDRTVADELIQRQPVLLEFPDRQAGPVDRERRGDHVDPAAVGKPGVADGRISSTRRPTCADDALADVHQLPRVVETVLRLLLRPPTSMKIRRVPLTMMSAMSSRASKGCERSVPENVVADVAGHPGLLGGRQRSLLGAHDAADKIADLGARLVGRHRGQARHIDHLDQCGEDLLLDAVVPRLLVAGFERRDRLLSCRGLDCAARRFRWHRRARRSRIRGRVPASEHGRMSFSLGSNRRADLASGWLRNRQFRPIPYRQADLTDPGKTLQDVTAKQQCRAPSPPACRSQRGHGCHRVSHAV